ncbi:MAG: sulfonate transporter, periplasmic sulfonate-binding protein [Hyphomicrobiales bacterium]|nr:sulfonate transporter, periplasmic sulfonate-binding protein [Hyphomicrobiales bacterium]
MSTSRKISLLVSAAALVFVTGAQAATPVRVGISQPAYSFVPLDIATQTGICKKQDLDVQKTVFSGSSQLHQALSADSVDIGLGAGPEMGFLAKGAPEKAIAAMADAPEDLALVVLKDGPVKTVADLKGRKISMSTRGSLTEWAARSLSLKQGWGPDGMTMVPLGSFSAQTAALKTRQIDGMVVEAGTAGHMDEEGSGFTLVRFGDIVPHFHIHVIFATNGIIANHPDTVKKFMACYFEGLDYMAAHRAESVKIASDTLNMSEALSGKLYDLLMPHYNRTGKFDKQALDVISQSMVDMGTFPNKLDLSKFYTEEFLPKAK